MQTLNLIFHNGGFFALIISYFFLVATIYTLKTEGFPFRIEKVITPTKLLFNSCIIGCILATYTIISEMSLISTAFGFFEPSSYTFTVKAYVSDDTGYTESVDLTLYKDEKEYHPVEGIKFYGEEIYLDSETQIVYGKENEVEIFEYPYTLYIYPTRTIIDTSPPTVFWAIFLFVPYIWGIVFIIKIRNYLKNKSEK